MYRTLWGFIIIAVSFAVASCTPIGTTHDDDSGADVDDFWTIPRRQYYTLGDNFVRDNDLRAFASHQGMVESIPASKVEISLVRNPDDDEPDNPIPIVNGQYPLKDTIVGSGRKLIIVSYGSKTDEYSIEVGSLDGSVGPSRPPDSGEGSGIGIDWHMGE